VAERKHRLIVRQVSRGDGVVLVPASYGNQHLMGCQPPDEPSCRLDISSRWYGDDHSIWLVSLHRYKPVPHRKIWSKMKNRHPSPPGRRGVREDAELMMAAGGQSGQQEREALAVHGGCVECGAQSPLHSRGDNVFPRNSHVSVGPCGTETLKLRQQPGVNCMLEGASGEMLIQQSAGREWVEIYRRGDQILN